jgi:hypothetical protein
MPENLHFFYCAVLFQNQVCEDNPGLARKWNNARSWQRCKRGSRGSWGYLREFLRLKARF